MRSAHGDHGGTEWEGQSKPVLLDAAEESVADGEVMLQGSFSVMGDFDVMMVEAAWLQGEAASNLVQVQTVAPGTVELSADSSIPQDPEVGKHTLVLTLVKIMYTACWFHPFIFQIA